MSLRSIGRGCLHFLVDNALSIAMLIAIILGFILGIILRQLKSFDGREVMYIGFLGELFLQMLKGVAVPLMVSCIIIAFATLDTSLAKIFGIQLVLYIIITKLIATTLGMTMVVICNPGGGGDKKEELDTSVEPGSDLSRETVDNFLDMIRNIFPENMIDIAMRQSVTNITKDSDGKKKYDEVMVEGSNMLGLVMFSIVSGLALKTMGADNKPIMDVILVFGQITFIIVKFIMYAAPILLVSLVAQQVVIADYKKFLSSIGMYALVASGTLLIHFFIVYPLIIFFVGRTNPFTLYWKFLDAITTSFASCSSMGSLPIAMKVIESKVGFDSSMVSFIVPICIAINKDGACINLAISSIFFAQYDQKKLQISDYVLVAIFSIATSLAAPGVPQGVLLMLIVILETIGLPGKYAGSIIAVDLIVDRIVTMINVTGSLVATTVIYNTTKKTRARLALESDEKEEEEPEQQTTSTSEPS